MGYAYQASVYFPKAAMDISEVAEALQSLYTDTELNINDELGIVDVSNSEAKYGSLPITDILNKHLVPYDHYHRNDIEGEFTTDHVRFDDAGERSVVIRNDNEKSGLELAKQVLELANAGDLEGIKDRVVLLLKGEPESVEDIANVWAPNQGTQTARPASQQPRG